MAANYELPIELGYRVEMARGTPLDEPQVEPLADSMPGLEIEWLWPGRIPFSRLTLIEGPPGCGKSFAALSIAAIASSGSPWPGCPQAPPLEAELLTKGGPAPRDQVSVAEECRSGNCSLPGPDVLRQPQGDRQAPVLLLSKVRHWDDMLGGRLERAGAQIELCHRFTHLKAWLPESQTNGEREVVFPYDVAALADLVGDMPAPRPKLVVIDALTDFCPRRTEIGRTIARLDEAAADAEVAIVATLPASVRRDGHGRLQVRPRGPDDRAACVWCIEEDPDDPRRRLFVPQRMTLCEWPGDPLAFRIRDGVVTWEELEAGSVVEPWRELSETAKWLRKVLAEGDLPASDLHRQARECGFSPKMLRAARQKLGVQLHRVGFGAEGHSVWSLAGAASGRAGNRAAGRTTHASRRAATPAQSVETSRKRRTNGHAPVNRIAKISVE